MAQPVSKHGKMAVGINKRGINRSASQVQLFTSFESSPDFIRGAYGQKYSFVYGKSALNGEIIVYCIYFSVVYDNIYFLTRSARMGR